MDKRRLGRSDLHIAPLMLGGNVFGWNVDEPTSFALLDAFIDAGFNAIDTADTYSRWVKGHQGGESETGHRQLAQTLGQARQGRDRHQNRQRYGRRQEPAQGLCAARGEACLKRLQQVDYIDLLQTHFDDEVTPPEETMPPMRS